MSTKSIFDNFKDIQLFSKEDTIKNIDILPGEWRNYTRELVEKTGLNIRVGNINRIEMTKFCWRTTIYTDTKLYIIITSGKNLSFTFYYENESILFDSSNNGNKWQNSHLFKKWTSEGIPKYIHPMVYIDYAVGCTGNYENKAKTLNDLFSYTTCNNKHDELIQENNILIDKYNELLQKYEDSKIIINEHEELTEKYNKLIDEYNELQEECCELDEKRSKEELSCEEWINDYYELEDKYNMLFEKHEESNIIINQNKELTEKYNKLEDEYSHLLKKYDKYNMLLTSNPKLSR